MIEDAAERLEEVYDYSDINSMEYRNHSRIININKASDKQLRALSLNTEQIIKVKEYIEKYGEISSIYELNLIEGFDSAFISGIKPFLEFQLDPEINIISRKNLIRKGKHSIISRYGRDLETAKGYQSIEGAPPAYNGNPDKLLFRYNYNYYERIRFGITMEKDPGESLDRGFDFYSFHFLYKSKSFVKGLAIGHYNLRFAQGLIMNTGFSPGTDLSFPVVMSLNTSLTAASGANEGKSLKGIATTLKPVRGLNVTLFFSSIYQDSRMIQKDTTSDQVLFSTIYETGLHRTFNELNSRNNLKISSLGSNIEFRKSILKIGFSALWSSLSSSGLPDSEPYAIFDFSGKQLNNYGADLSLNWRSLTAFGEYATSPAGSAFLSGFNVIPSTEYGFSFVYRDYSKGYYSFYSNTIGKASCKNESGMLVSFFGNISNNWSITATADQFTFPWLRYNVDAPSGGSDYAIQLKYKWYEKNEIYFRYSSKKGMKNPAAVDTNIPPTVDDIVMYPIDIQKNCFRLQISYFPNTTINLKNRLEIVINKQPGKPQTSGYFIYQDINVNPSHKAWSVNFRYALFDIETYYDRIYAYENDLLYAWSIPAYYYKGSRIYAMIRYNFKRNTTFWLRYSNTYYPGKSSIGTGWEETSGNTRSDIRLQCLIKI